MSGLDIAHGHDGILHHVAGGNGGRHSGNTGLEGIESPEEKPMPPKPALRSPNLGSNRDMDLRRLVELRSSSS